MRLNSLWAIGSGSAWRDVALAAVLAGLAALVSALVDLHERIFDFTRSWEQLQLDEWPSALLVFVGTMVVLHTRRHAQLRRVLGENQRLVGRIIEVQEAERRRLARELHDELGQYLNAIKLDAHGLHQAGTLSDVQAAATRIGGNTDHAYGAAANLVRNLRPPALDELGLEAALESLVAGWRRSHSGIDVRLAMGGNLDGLGERLNLTIYRIVQEALTNCVRHARARNVFIDLTRAHGEGRSLLLEIRDDGIGMRVEAPEGGSGLAGMRERVALAGGTFDLLSGPREGVTIRVEVPLPDDQE